MVGTAGNGNVAVRAGAKAVDAVAAASVAGGETEGGAAYASCVVAYSPLEGDSESSGIVAGGVVVANV